VLEKVFNSCEDDERVDESGVFAFDCVRFGLGFCFLASILSVVRGIAFETDMFASAREPSAPFIVGVPVDACVAIGAREARGLSRS
jgi:hypothetical protein